MLGFCRYESIQIGEPAEAIVLSSKSGFSTFKVCFYESTDSAQIACFWEDTGQMEVQTLKLWFQKWPVLVSLNKQTSWTILHTVLNQIHSILHTVLNQIDSVFIKESLFQQWRECGYLEECKSFVHKKLSFCELALQALREVYFPESGLWMSEYPHVNRNLFLDISLDIERARRQEMMEGTLDALV